MHGDLPKGGMVSASRIDKQKDVVYSYSGVYDLVRRKRKWE